MSIAIIGGSGLDQLDCFKSGQSLVIDTPYGEHSGPILKGTLSTLSELAGTADKTKNSSPVYFIPRHNAQHGLPPHGINYRANLWALKSLGVQSIVACNVVGGITEKMSPSTLVVPHQIVDYTWGREHTFYDGAHSNSSNKMDDGCIDKLQSEWLQAGVQHIDFTQPYSLELRGRLIEFLQKNNHEYIDGAVYACTQGPRLETAAEVKRLQQDGCDIVGMTAMPEASLARELSIEYAALSLVVNWAPGIADEELSIEQIMKNIAQDVQKMNQFIPFLLNSLH